MKANSLNFAWFPVLSAVDTLHWPLFFPCKALSPPLPQDAGCGGFASSSGNGLVFLPVDLQRWSPGSYFQLSNPRAVLNLGKKHI